MDFGLLQKYGILEKVSQQSNLARKSQIKLDILCYNQKEKYRRLCWCMTLWNDYELANLGPIKNICCVKSIEKLHEERKLMEFLIKLQPRL